MKFLTKKTFCCAEAVATQLWFQKLPRDHNKTLRDIIKSGTVKSFSRKSFNSWNDHNKETFLSWLLLVSCSHLLICTFAWAVNSSINTIFAKLKESLNSRGKREKFSDALWVRGTGWVLFGQVHVGFLQSTGFLYFDWNSIFRASYGWHHFKVS